ncbi:MAG: metallophosphoesterase [Methanomassiliicoccaceae archaeon]|nr:metallophosphoesterase [Methanomassiliicoccaceae archaeon]MCL2145765.1 metallophosphoesterase [Methanomassiliicoccaceae archaeon]
MDLQPVHGIPALRADEYLVIGDLHIGIESHLRSKGFHLTSRTDDMFDSIIKAADDSAGRLMVLGDVKDSVPGSTKQEYREIPVFFERLLERFDSVEVVRGNHDTNIEEFLPGHVRIRPASGVKIEDTGFVHGHTWPSEEVMTSETLVMAHDHPAVMFRDGVGKQTNEPCWVRGRFRDAPSERYGSLPKNFIIVPAFNRMLGGSPVNIRGEPLLGPIMGGDLLDLENATVHLLDGLDLGRLSGLMVAGSERRGWGRRIRVKTPEYD